MEHIKPIKQYLEIAEILVRDLVQSGNEELITDQFHLAVERGNVLMAKLLLSEGADVNVKDSLGRTPLHTAAMNNGLLTTELLLSYGASVDVKDVYGYTAVHYAIVKEIIDQLLGREVDVKWSVFTRYILELVKEYRLRNGIPLHTELRTYDDPRTMRRDIVGMNKVNAQLYGIIKKECLKIAKELLELGADVNKLYDSRQSNKRTTLLHIAVLRNHEQMVRLLISHKADVNVRDDWNHRPIRYAVQNNNMKLMQLLLANGAKIKDEPGLGCVVAEKYKRMSRKMVQFLLRHDIDVNGRNRYGNTALHICLNHYDPSYLPFIESLLEHGADVNATDKHGQTPLHIAAHTMDGYQVVPALLRRGSDINALDKKNLTPFAAALSYKYPQRYRGEEIHDFWLVEEFLDDFEDIMIVIFVQQIIKMKMAGLYVNSVNMAKFNSISRYSPIEHCFERTCNAELKKILTTIIRNKRVTIRDIFTKSWSQLARCLGDENFVQTMVRLIASRSLSQEVEFPLYGTMIVGRLKSIFQRQELLDETRDYFYRLYRLPDICAEKIFSYLSNIDLRILRDSMTEPRRET